MASGVEMYAGGAVLSEVGVYTSEYANLTESIPGIPVRLLAYQDKAVRSLRRLAPDAPLAPPDFLTNYKEPASDASRFACDLWFFETYYFAHHGPAQRVDFMQKVKNTTSLSDNTAQFYSHPDWHTPDGFTRVMAIDFSQEDYTQWMRVGNAFDTLPTTEKLGHQSAIAGHVGAFINTYTKDHGDQATGALQSPVFLVDGDVITLRIGGGRDLEKVRVSLVVDGREVVSATGCGSEIMGRRIWDVSKYRGREARLLIVDQHAGGWGHIMVDEIEVWRKEV